MNSIIRAGTLLALVSAVSAAQSGRPPVPPAPPAPPAPAARPMPAPRVHIDSDELAQTIRQASIDAERAARDMSRDALEQSRDAIRASIDASREAMETARMSMSDMHIEIPHIDMPRIEIPMNLDMPMHLGGVDGGPRYQDDPADSLYRAAVGLLNNTDYRAAAQRFKEVQQKYPNSRYLQNAMYYQAFSLYRAGTDAELKDALSVLDALQKQFPNATGPNSNRIPRGGVNTNSVGTGRGAGMGFGGGMTYVNVGNSPDVPALQMRIRSALAARGDVSAKRQLDQSASDTTCDKEQISVQSEALSGLMRVDPAAASSHLDKILAKRDKCSIGLRQTALMILARNGDEKSVATLITTAKSDPSADLRSTAVDYLSRVQSEDALTTLASLAKSEQNDMVRRSAARALVGYSSNRARQAVRDLIEDNSVPDDIRTDMLRRFSSDRGTAEDAAWMRAAYPRITSQNVKREIVGAVGRIGGTDSQKWLIDIAGNDQETSSIRAEAFRTVSKSMSVADLGKAYDASGARQQRESIVDALNNRKEPEAVDKLLDIVEKGTDPQVRMRVINLLSNRKDPKITAALLKLIDK